MIATRLSVDDDVIPLAGAWRGSVMECCHRGRYCVATREGRVLASGGSIRATVLLRSTAKPFQAMPVVQSGAAAEARLSIRELALLVASHSGEPLHVEIGRQMMARLSIPEFALECGVHYPFSLEATLALARAEETPSVLHNNCIGKHIGMLLLARHQGWSLTGYLDRRHPVQAKLLTSLSQVTRLRQADIGLAIDGCGAPTYSVPLQSLALAYAELAASVRHGESVALGTLGSAMMSEPRVTAGSECFETTLMERLAGTIIAKRGADGLLCLSIPAEGVGIAIKAESGSAAACAVAAIWILRSVGFLSACDGDPLMDLSTRAINTWSGTQAGELLPMLPPIGSR